MQGKHRRRTKLLKVVGMIGRLSRLCLATTDLWWRVRERDRGIGGRIISLLNPLIRPKGTYIAGGQQDLLNSPNRTNPIS